MRHPRFVRKFTLLLIFICCLGLSGSGWAAEIKSTVNLAILPCTNIEITFKKFYPLITYLKKATGYEVRLVVPANFNEFKNSLKRGTLDFALQDPHTYVILSNLFIQDKLLRTLTMTGDTTQSGVVIVRQNSHIHKLTDLKGKTVMFGSKSSSNKWLAAKLLFEANGLNLDRDLKAYSHGGCCEDIAFSVYLKSVDAGVVCDHFLGEHEEKQIDLGVEAGKIVAIAKTQPVPTRVFAACKGTPDAIVTAVNTALLKLDRKNPEHARILFRAELGGFQPARDQDDNSIRLLMTTAD